MHFSCVAHLCKIFRFTAVSHCHKGLLPPHIPHVVYQDPQAFFMQNSFLTSCSPAGTVTWDCFVPDLSICLCKNLWIFCQQPFQPVKITVRSSLALQHIKCYAVWYQLWAFKRCLLSHHLGHYWRGLTASAPWAMPRIIGHQLIFLLLITIFPAKMYCQLSAHYYSFSYQTHISIVWL